ncbi:MAG: hypothetical protein K2W95_25325 [Candidatus Obscuribacterales bacterium]|nr:hypothetical protein [Candidatus Obscuribacterales bacterium]
MNTQASKSSVSSCWVTSAIRRFLVTIVEGAIFATRDLLSIGSRSSIDSALSRMVASGRIVRLASGLFMKPKASDPDWRPPTETIVQSKLLVFRRIGVAVSETPVKAQDDTPALPGDQTVTYEISGNRSRFRLFNGIFVQVRSMANRKLDLAQCDLGTKLKTLWQSADRICEDSVRAFLSGLGREEKSDIKVLLALLPHHLSDLLGAPWNHKTVVIPISSISDRSRLEWFSLNAISQSRSLRSMKHPPPPFELNF